MASHSAYKVMEEPTDPTEVMKADYIANNEIITPSAADYWDEASRNKFYNKEHHWDEKNPRAYLDKQAIQKDYHEEIEVWQDAYFFSDLYPSIDYDNQYEELGEEIDREMRTDITEYEMDNARSLRA